MKKEKNEKKIKVTNNIKILKETNKIISKSQNEINTFSAAIKGINKANEIVDISKLTSYFLNIENVNDNYEKINNIIKIYAEVSKIMDESHKKIMHNELANYKNIIKKIVIKKNIDDNHLDFLNIVSEIYSEKIKTLSILSKSLIDHCELLQNQNNQSELTSIESIIPIFLGYTYRKDSSKSLSEAYEESTLKILVDSANKILNKINNINLLYRNINKKDLFDYNSSTFSLYKMDNVVQDESGFKELINILYKGLFESSSDGTDNIILKNKNLCNSQILMVIKKFRQYYFHKHEGKNDKEEIVLKYINQKIGKRYPSRPKDWVDLQACIYEDIDLLLDEIFEYYNVLD